MSTALPEPESAFFISRAGPQAEFATWVSDLIRAQNRTTLIQDDFGPQNFLDLIARGIAGQGRLVALFSPEYIDSEHCRAEALAALNGDPLNRLERLVPIRIKDCAPAQLLGSIGYCNLLPELRARDAAAVAYKILTWLRIEPVTFAGLPPLPPGLVLDPIRHLHHRIAPRPSFTGREDLLDTLSAHLFGGSKTAAALTNSLKPARARADEALAPPPAIGSNSLASEIVAGGMGGVGKSELAREYGWRNQDAYAGVWWIEADTPTKLHNGLVALGMRISPRIAELAEKDRTEAARQTVIEIQNARFEKPWLLIYDNVDSVTALDGFRPHAGAHILITSRERNWGGEAEVVDVGLFSPAVAVDYLMRNARRSGSAARAEAARLAEALGHLPLALSHAASYLASPSKQSISFADYHADYEARLKHEPAATSRAGKDYPRSVYTTFSTSLEEVAKTHPKAELVMATAAFLAPEGILDTLFFTPDEFAAIIDDIAGNPLAIGLEQDDSESGNAATERPGEEQLTAAEAACPFETKFERAEVLEALERAALIDRIKFSDGQFGFNVHRLVQVVVRDVLEKKAQEAADLAVVLVTAAFPVSGDDARHWAECRRLEPHVVEVLKQGSQSGDPGLASVSLGSRYAGHLIARAEYKAAEKLLRMAFKRLDSEFGLDHPMVSAISSNLGMLFRHTGRLSEAETLQRYSLRLLEKSLGSNSPQVAAACMALGDLLQITGRLDEAEAFHRRALHLFETALDPEHPTVGMACRGLGALLRIAGRFDESEPLLRRSLAIFEASYGPDHPEVGDACNSLAVLLAAANRLGDVEQLYRRALEIWKASLGPDHPRTALATKNLGAFLADTKRFAEAEPLLRDGLLLSERSLGEASLQVADCCMCLADMLRDTHRAGDAEPLIRRVIAIREDVLGMTHPQLAAACHSLGHLLLNDERPLEAVAFLQRAAELTPGAGTLRDLAIALFVTGHITEAEPLISRALAFAEECFPAGHATLANCREWHDRISNSARAAENASGGRIEITVTFQKLDLGAPPAASLPRLEV